MSGDERLPPSGAECQDVVCQELSIGCCLPDESCLNLTPTHVFGGTEGAELLRGFLCFKRAWAVVSAMVRVRFLFHRMRCFGGSFQPGVACSMRFALEIRVGRVVRLGNALRQTSCRSQQDSLIWGCSVLSSIAVHHRVPELVVHGAAYGDDSISLRGHERDLHRWHWLEGGGCGG